jgi:tartrate dehydrogenase/decarboxylase/D-malate dehydrogenase
MMMDYLGHPDLAGKIEAAVEWSLVQGIKTPDLGGSSTTSGVAGEIIKKMITLQ